MSTSTQHLHFDLADLLQKKEQQDAQGGVNRIKEMLKGVGDRLRLEPAIDEHLDAAFAYYVAGYYVRASRLISQIQFNDDTHPAQRWLALFIAKRFQCISNHVTAINVDYKYSDEGLEHAIRHCGLSDSEALDRILLRKAADGLSAFLEFVREGDDSELEVVNSTFSSCQDIACKSREWRWWWWIECIRLVIAEFAENCLWTQLKSMKQENGASSIVSRYITANYERNNPVVELWRTQVESLPKINDPERRSFCLSIPTSGGKTRVAELAILRFLLDCRDDPNAKCVYIAPLRKLANEVEQTLSPVFSIATSSTGVVSSFYGGREVDLLDQDQLTEARILIVTPEKLDGLIRNNPKLCSQIRLVIADEGHMIGDDDDRGYRYRMLLERLVFALRIRPTVSRPVKARLLFVSGVLPNASEFATLIAGDSSSLVHIDWRPMDEPLMTRWEWNGNSLTTSNKLLPPPVLFHAPGCESTNTFEEIVVRAAFTHALSSHTLVFSASKRAIESDSLLDLLDCLLDRHPLTDNPLSPAISRPNSLKRYYRLLERGVAVHHSGLPLALKNETEARIYDGRVRLLFASPTLAQGVNIPFDTVLVYRLQHYAGKAINAATFWNVVGRVGRPISGGFHRSANLHPPQVAFFNNKASNATKEDQIDIDAGRKLVSREKQYRVASPFLQFLNKLKTEWKQNTGKSVAELVSTLAERSDLQWVTKHDDRRKLSSLLRQLDEHLIALAEESEEEADGWLQARTRDVVDLLVQATTIEASDLEFIRAAVLARAQFVIRHIPKSRRHQDYLLGLPLEDCDTIRKHKNELFIWYQGCADIFARRLQPGIDNLMQILDFVSSLSICPKKWRSSKDRQLPLLDPDMPILWRKWIQGEDTAVVASVLNQIKPDADFDEYRQDMLEDSLAWGLSAICKFLEEVGREEGFSLTRDLEFLPSIVKYGVPGKLACYLVRLKMPREAATKIAELYADRLNSKDALTLDVVQSESRHAEQAIRSLTEEDIQSLDLSNAVVERIKEIKVRISLQAATLAAGYPVTAL